MEGNQLYIPQALTNMSQQYRNLDDTYIADLIAPELLVEKKTGLYLSYAKNLRTATNSLRTGRSKTAEVSLNTSWKPYTTLKEHALKDGIEKDVFDMYQNPLDPMMDSTQNVMDKMTLERETIIAGMMADTTQVTQYSSPSVQWNASTGAGSPIIDISTAVSTMLVNGLRKPNTIVIGWQAWLQLMNHPDFLDRIKFSQLGTLTESLFGQIISESSGTKITRVLIGEAVVDSSNEQIPHPGTTSNGFIWGKHLWLMYCTPTPGLRQVNGIYTLRLKNGRYVDGWPDQDRKTTYIRVNDYFTPFLVGPEAIYFLQNVVA